MRLVNRLLEAPSAEPGYLALLRQTHRVLVQLGPVLNLLQADPQEMVATLRQKAADLKIAPQEIEQLIAARTQAREKKDWTKADNIRNKLFEMDIILEDTPQGTVWRVRS